MDHITSEENKEVMDTVVMGEEEYGNLDQSRIEFTQIMEKLLKQAHENKNVLEYKDINDAFTGSELSAEKFEWILDYFEKQGVDVLNTNEEDNDDSIDAMDAESLIRMARGDAEM